MRRSFSLLVAVGLFVFPVLGCSKSDAGQQPSASAPQANAAATLPDRDPALAHKLVAEGAVLLDVRTTGEFGDRHLDKAVNVPVDELQTRLGEIEKLSGGDKSKPIVVYCQAGGRAGRAKKALTEAGFSQVTNLGGIDAWDAK